MIGGRWPVFGGQSTNRSLLAAHRNEAVSMSTVKSFRELEVWQKAVKLAVEVYRVSKQFPRDERFGLTNQIRRASTSIPANIAEGSERDGTKEFLQFLGIASGSLAEVETFLLLAMELQMLPQPDYQALSMKAGEVGRLLNGLKRSLRSKL
jgi:four helix bundle protein